MAIGVSQITAHPYLTPFPLGMKSLPFYLSYLSYLSYLIYLILSIYLIYLIFLFE